MEDSVTQPDQQNSGTSRVPIRHSASGLLLAYAKDLRLKADGFEQLARAAELLNAQTEEALHDMVEFWILRSPKGR